MTQHAPFLPTTCGSFTLSHRLDLQVSGCIAFAKSKRAATHFHQLLARAEDQNSVEGSRGGDVRGLRKIYRAVTFRAVPTGICTHWAQLAQELVRICGPLGVKWWCMSDFTHQS